MRESRQDTIRRASSAPYSARYAAFPIRQFQAVGESLLLGCQPLTVWPRSAYGNRVGSSPGLPVAKRFERGPISPPATPKLARGLSPPELLALCLPKTQQSFFYRRSRHSPGLIGCNGLSRICIRLVCTKA